MINDNEKTVLAALLHNGSQTQGALYRLVMKHMARETFLKHLRILVEQGKIREVEDGQYRVYSLSRFDGNSFDERINKFLDELITDVKEPMSETEKLLKKFENGKQYEKSTSIDKINVYYVIFDQVEIILKWSNMLSLMLNGGFATLETKQKARELQKLYNQKIQELFQSARKIHRPLCEMVFSNVLDEIKPMLSYGLTHPTYEEVIEKTK